MARLTTKLHPILTENVIHSLFSNNIYTTIDFLNTEPEMIVKFTTVSYKEALLVRKQIAKKYSAKIENGLQHYKNLVSGTAAIISTSIKSLNKILNGGLSTSKLYEICGLAASGKTQLSMTIATNVAQYLQQTVYYIDTKRDFSGRKIQKILEARGCLDEKLSGPIMEKIKVVQILNTYELLNTLHSLKQDLKEQMKIRLIIIDSLPAVFNQIIDDQKCRVILNELTNVLRYISKTFHVAIIVVNTMNRWIEISTEYQESSLCTSTPSLGKYWQHIPNVRIMLEKSQSSDEVTLTVLKNSNNIQGITVKATINDSGFS